VSEAELAYLLLYTNPREEDAIELYLKLGDLGSATPKKTLELSRLPHLEKLRRDAAVQREIHNLPLNERTVIELRFGILDDEEFTLRDIGEILNLSRERVRQIEARAEAKCRRNVRRDVLNH
jgi:RNA polymerase sigma factor (sigma-70 family)